MSTKVRRLIGKVTLSNIGALDETTLRALYARKPKPTLEDLRAELANLIPTQVHNLSVPVDVDVSSMYTVAKALHSGVRDAEWAGFAADAENGLNGLLLSAKAKGVWLWLAYKLLLEPVHNNTVTLYEETEGDAGSSRGTVLALSDVAAGDISTWLWDLDSAMSGLRWYRHRIAGPLTVYHRRHELAGDAAAALTHVMRNSPLSTGEIYEQVVSRPDIVLTGALLEINTRIGNGTLSSGSGTGSSRVAGAQILQAALTHDLSTGSDPGTLFL